MKRFLKYYKNHKGIAIVWMALLLAFLLLFLLGVAVDISFMYFTRNQLQVAADASATAGVDYLGGTDDTINDVQQEKARQEAWRFACLNKAAGIESSDDLDRKSKKVFLVTNVQEDCNQEETISASQLNGGLNDKDGDIVVGNWNPNRTQVCPTASEDGVDDYVPFCRANGSTGLSINAIKTVARRTSDPATDVSMGDNPVRVYVSQILRLMNLNWGLMNAKAEAIATRPLVMTPSLSLCVKSCEMSGLPKLLDIQSNLEDGADYGLAWTVFSSESSVPANEIKDFIDGTTRLTADDIIALCNDECITTQNGADTINYFGAMFRDPNFDSGNKDIVDGVVTGWTIGIIITDYHCCPESGCDSCCPPPPTCEGKKQDICTCGPYDCYQGCPPSDQGGGQEPYHVEKWGKATISDVCDNQGQHELCVKKGVILSALECRGCDEDPLDILQGENSELVK